MGVKERRQRERTEVREKILDAALEFFANHGAEGVTMRALADAIEYSAPVIYAHFRDKDAIIQELCFRQIRELGKVFVTFADMDPLERLRRVGYSYVDFAIEHPSHFRFLFLTAHPLEVDMDEEEKNDPQRHAYAFLRQAVADAVAAGLFRPQYTDVEEIAQLCWGSAHGLVALQNIKGSDTWVNWRDARTSARRLIDVTLDGLVKPGVQVEAKQQPTRAVAPRNRERQSGNGKGKPSRR
jgi:AcrR family transcriptional regulator